MMMRKFNKNMERWNNDREEDMKEGLKDQKEGGRKREVDVGCENMVE